MVTLPTPDHLRSAMAALPTGVTIVTAIGEQGPAGATANAVTSLSLDPPLMLACLDRGSRTLEIVQAHGRFGVSVLAADQEPIARAFASKAPHTEKFREVEFTEHAAVPILAASAAWVVCALRDLHDGGDHRSWSATCSTWAVEGETRWSSSAAATARSTERAGRREPAAGAACTTRPTRAARSQPDPARGPAPVRGLPAACVVCLFQPSS